MVLVAPAGRQLTIDGRQFAYAGGDPRVEQRRRPSQPGDPGDLVSAEWRTDGPDFASFERILPGEVAGYLGRDYGDGTTGIFEGIDTLGPLLNTIALGTFDQTFSASLPGTASFIPGQTLRFGNGESAQTATVAARFGRHLYIFRGVQVAKVDLSPATPVVRFNGKRFDQRATTALLTQAETGVFPTELSAGLGDQAPYEVLTIAAESPNSDSWQRNDGGDQAVILGQAPDRAVALRGQEIASNIITGQVTMRLPNWAQFAAVRLPELDWTGFQLDGDLWVLGSTAGPLMLDRSAARFFPLIPEVDTDVEHGQLSFWSFMGVITMDHEGLRYLRGGSGDSFGPERFRLNTSPVQGQPHAFAGTTRGGIAAFHNHDTGDSWLIEFRRRSDGDYHGLQWSPYVLGKISGQVSGFVAYLGTAQGYRDNLTIFVGDGTNARWFTRGFPTRELDDAAWRCATAGTTFLTDMRRNPGQIKDIEAVELSTAGCAAARTVTVGLSIDGGATYQDLPVVNSNGFQRQVAVGDDGPLVTLHGGRTIKPRLVHATNDSSLPTQVISTFRVLYRVRTETVREWVAALTLEGSNRGTTEEQQEALDALIEAGPVKVEGLVRGSLYCRVQSADASDVRAVTAGQGRVDTQPHAVYLRMTEWSAK